MGSFGWALALFIDAPSEREWKGACSQLEQLGCKASARMKTKRQFSANTLAVLRESKGLRIRAGTGQHRFIGIWVVVVKDVSSSDRGA